MKTNPRIQTQNTSGIRPGNILIAKPFWLEETYKRSVVLLIHHNSQGSTGIILNKMSNLFVHEALPDLNTDAPLYYGGPMNKKIISYIHTNPEMPDSFYLGNDLFWGGNYEFLCEMFESGQIGLSEFHFCAGFVQWEPGQLENEMSNKWWQSEICKSELFLLPPDELWANKLVNEQHIYGLFNYHPDPSIN